ncbi:MAG: LysM peptidoglycan-binding domain-containing protein [Defluviitaleaceae bacterium]|nr:LysM peptidoglycan-binding domain-containing protein [Defluviitaleaceae bacterium]MCL2836366.1 LysM peptidoglycan-binding domain-containing protein [Defluviitaleaceae bacterium]
MNEFELPTNIRQIGGVDDRLRIYVEDYAISYLKRFAESGGDNERLAFLIGKYMVIDSQGYLFVCGAVQGKYTARDDGAETFTDESFEYAQSCLDKYFEGYEIVGWMQSQPGYGTGLNPVCADYHMNNFIKPYHSLLVIDPVEKLESFYLWEKNMSEMVEAKGYFIFYDRNRGMQEYILDHRLSSVRGFSRGKAGEKAGKTVDFRTRSDSYRTRDSSRGTEKRVMGSPEYKKVVNMLVSLSAVLFVICFIMGAGLIQGDGKITQLEKDMSALNSAFGYVLNQVNQMVAQASEPVFAPADQNRAPSNFDENRGVVNILPETQDVTIIPRDYTAISTTPEPETVPTTSPLNISATPQPVTEPGVHQPQTTPSPNQIPVNLSEPPAVNPTATPNVGLTHQDAMAALMENGEFDTYTVQRGDTLSGICFRYYGTTDMIEKVMEVNGITHPDMIFFGRVLLMPRVETVMDE